MMSSLLRWLTRRVGLQKKQLTEQGDEEEDKYWTKLDIRKPNGKRGSNSKPITPADLAGQNLDILSPAYDAYNGEQAQPVV